jgi:hypothetical protein
LRDPDVVQGNDHEQALARLDAMPQLKLRLDYFWPAPSIAEQKSFRKTLY